MELHGLALLDILVEGQISDIVFSNINRESLASHQAPNQPPLGAWPHILLVW